MSLAVLGEFCNTLPSCADTNFHAQTYSAVSCNAVYITANVSGGHLNPAVTLATMITGHISFPKGVTYIVTQIFGACIGMLLVVCPLS